MQIGLASRFRHNCTDRVHRARSTGRCTPSSSTSSDTARGKSVFCARDNRLARTTVEEAAADSFTVIGLLAVLGKPLALSLGDTAWVRHRASRRRSVDVARATRHRAPRPDRGLAAWGSKQPVALLVLGPRRSEEPYNEEDLELLDTIAHALGELFDRPSSDVTHLRIVRVRPLWALFRRRHPCVSRRPGAIDGARALRALNGRYRLDCRLGSGRAWVRSMPLSMKPSNGQWR